MNNKWYKSFKFKENGITYDRAITLISLVVTIIILIILAGVVISISLGKNGIFNKTKTAKEKYEIAQIREKIEMVLINIEVEKLEKEPLKIEETLQEMLERKTFESIDKTEQIGNIGEYEVKLKYDKKNKVVIEYIQKATGVRTTYELNPIGYTNKEEVEIILKLKGNIKKVTKPDGKVLTEKEIGEELKYKVTSNGTYKFIVEDEQGKVKEKEIIVDTIDMLEPREFEIEAETIRTGIIRITGNTEDRETDGTSIKSGIKKYEYYVKLETEKEYTKYDINEIENLPIGKYKIYVVAYDKAGNKTRSKNEVEVQIEEWIEIWNEEDLRNMANGLDSNYILMDDIELTREWVTIGDNSNTFLGKLEGNNHEIIGVKINIKQENYQGVFGAIGRTGKVNNLSIECNIITEGSLCVGGLSGQNEGTIDNVKVSGTVIGNNYVGGIVGINSGGTIKKTSSYGSVEGNNYIGGIAGTNSDGIIEKTSNYGAVEGNEFVGGLVGDNNKIIEKSLSKGDVQGVLYVGGLVGENYGIITNAYSTGTVIGKRCVGGLVGENRQTVTNVYTISKVIGDSNIGGLVYAPWLKTVVNGYWTQKKAGISIISDTDGTPLTLDQMKTQSSYENWDFSTGTVWKMGEEYPELVFESNISE